MSIRNLERLLTPRSVVVVGASVRPHSVGATVWSNLAEGGFAGALHAVNPKHRSLGGRPVFARVAELPAPADLAIVCTPPDTVPGLIAELAAAGTRAAIVMTGGLGAAHTQAMLNAARPHTLRLLGPNCLGLLTPRLHLNASFAHTDALAGDLAFVSQSGALVTAMLDWAKARGIGFSHLISLGESADVDFGDLLDHLASDGATRGILLYAESIRERRKFMSAARAAARNKPVIIVKAGRAGNGIAAAASHSGAMAGSDLVFDAAIRRAGMLRVETMQDMFLAAQTLARMRNNRSDVLTVLTNGGGGGVLAADAAPGAGATLATLQPALLVTLDGLLPPTWSHGNPVDIIGDAPAERYSAALRALLADTSTGAVLLIHAPTAIVASADIARECVGIAQAARDRVIGCWLGGPGVAEARAIFQQAGVADCATPEEAVRAFAMLGTYRRNQAQLLEAPTASPFAAAPDTAPLRATIARVLAAGRQWLDAVECQLLLDTYGVAQARCVRADATASAAVAAACRIGYPLALKLDSRDITHKSDVGGVVLGLDTPTALRRAARAMLTQVRALRPDAHIDGFTLQQMVHRPAAHELIVGASIDPVFGPVVLFGHGGVSVEVQADRSIGLPPLNQPLARELISRTRVARLLAGYRGRPPAQLDAVAQVLTAVSCMLADLPELAELDINPLLADADGVIALDVRVRVSADRPAGAEQFAIRPYPQALVETVPWQGAPLTLRPIRPEDELQHRAFLERLDPEDIRMRIFYTRRELPRSELARLTQIDYAREMAFIAEREVSGVRETIGAVRAITDPDGVEAEFAVIIRSDQKGLGLGMLLMDKIIRHGRAQHLQRIVGSVLRGNTGMLALAKRCGFTVDHSQPQDDGVVQLVLQL